MGFRSSNTFNFESFELDGESTNMGDSFNGACDLLESKGLANRNGEPPVTILLSNNLDGPAGEKRIFAKVYIGATPEQVIEDLSKQTKS